MSTVRREASLSVIIVMLMLLFLREGGGGVTLNYLSLGAVHKFRHA